MRLVLSVWILGALPLCGVDSIKSDDPKLFRDQAKTVDIEVTTPKTMPSKAALGLYRDWINPVKAAKSPSNQTREQVVITPSVRKLGLEQTFFKSKEWKPGKVVHLYEKSKDFDHLLNPLSLKDFNRFIYQRNSKSP